MSLMYVSFAFQTKLNSKFGSNSNPSSRSSTKKYYQNSGKTQENVSHLQQTLDNQEIQRMVKSGLIQPKLRISQPNDPYEREADRVVDQIMRMTDSHVEETTIQNNSDNKIQRKCSSCQMNKKKKEEEKGLKISRKSVSTNSSNLETSDEVYNQIINTSGGDKLDRSTKDFMESRFGHDFSDVRIHDDSKSQQLARSVNARAFTTGNDVFLGQNESVKDKRLMAHELTHVVQQDSRVLIQRNGPQEETEQPISHMDFDPETLSESSLRISNLVESFFNIPGNSLSAAHLRIVSEEDFSTTMSDDFIEEKLIRLFMNPPENEVGDIALDILRYYGMEHLTHFSQNGDVMRRNTESIRRIVRNGINRNRFEMHDRRPESQGFPFITPSQLISMYISGFTTGTTGNRQSRMIIMPVGSNLGTVTHEIIHYYSHQFFNNEVNRVARNRFFHGLPLTEVLIEGFTETFTRIFLRSPAATRQLGQQSSSSYESEVTMAHPIIMTIGSEAARNAYFNGDRDAINLMWRAIRYYVENNPRIIIPSDWLPTE